MIPKDIISVSEYLDNLNLDLRKERAKIIGEVSGVQEYPGRSYLYFSLKDSKDGSTVKCFMWKNDYNVSGVDIKDGLEVVVSAYPAIYKPNGGLSLQVESLELIGEGALQIAYEKLKKKLELEGLFSPLKKRQIPNYPSRIGLITSKSGAVINDFLTNIGKFGFEIVFVDSKVEGADAIKDLLSALETLKDKNLDVLLIMRGGGSLESFQAFNNETLVRAVSNFPVPVLTGIGHDKDVPLVSMVSDKNVSTPTAVANLLNQSWKEAVSEVSLSEERILSKFSIILRDKQFFIENSVIRMERGIGLVSDSINRAVESISRNFSKIVENTQILLTQSKKTLDLLNPTRQLKQGYSIVMHGGKVIKSVSQIEKNEKLDIVVSDGIIHTQTL
ncbi:MAG: exodeoxyribonuclease VII large subunit [Minisyncoccia bacterium]